MTDLNQPVLDSAAARQEPDSRIEQNAFADEVTQAVVTVFPHDPPRFQARTSHGYHDAALIRAEWAAPGTRTSRS